MIGSGRGLDFDKIADYYLQEDYRKTIKLGNKLGKKRSEILDYLILARDISVVVFYTGVIVFLLMVICGSF